MEYRKGLNVNTSVGFAGQYRENVEEDIITLQTVVWRAGWFSRAGRKPELLYAFDLPEKYSVEKSGRSWTGKTLGYRWDGGGFDLELRSTLPGPLFRMCGPELTLRFGYPNEPRRAESLESDTVVGLKGGECDGRVWLMDMKPHPLLIVATKAVKKFTVVSHRHWRLRFDGDDASVFALPLLDADDAPREKDLQELWFRLAEHPPLQCEESFAFENDTMHISQYYPGADGAPRSPQVEYLLSQSGLVDGDVGRTLVKGWAGPYAVTPGDTVETSVKADWLQYAAVPTKEVAGELGELPEPLAFPGDGTWDDTLTGDRLMAWRLWAPHFPQLGERRQKELLERLPVPTPDEWRRDLRYETETVNDAKWARHDDLWKPIGDAAYDYDWYNGLALSGLAKACECDEDSVAEKAQRLASECKDIRADLARYMEVYHDWQLWMSWTDTFGTVWNLDCATNGLEGLLGEARMRRREGDDEGAEWIEYLAGKTGVGMLAALFLPDWLRRNGFQWGDLDWREETLGFKGMYPYVRIAYIEPIIRNPYWLPRRIPQYSALLRLYGPCEAMRKFMESWEKDYPVRYQDWQSLYLDPPEDMYREYRERAIEITPEAGSVETGSQAYTMHIVQPDILLRTWVFEQNPAEVEAIFKTPLELAEQLLLRAAYKIEKVNNNANVAGILR